MPKILFKILGLLLSSNNTFLGSFTAYDILMLPPPLLERDGMNIDYFSFILREYDGEPP